MTATPDREGHFLSIIDGLVLEIDSLSKNIRDLKDVLTQRLNFAADEVRHHCITPITFLSLLG